ncbi:MAG: Cys-tRNA(Pro) deacylase [Anaerolineae bacterium]|nr:Cys-tRNA(Pro) deacylase [Anaerolineae bacterium]
MTIKNNVTRMLDGKKIPYRAHQLPPEKLGALEAAEYLGVSPQQMFKTIVVLRLTKGKPILALVSGESQVDAKALANVVGEKKVKVSTQAEAEKLTGLQTGGISPLALINKGFQVIIDQSAETHEDIYISGGQRGINIQLKPGDLIKITQARLGNISKPL